MTSRRLDEDEKEEGLLVDSTSPPQQLEEEVALVDHENGDNLDHHGEEDDDDEDDDEDDDGVGLEGVLIHGEDDSSSEDDDEDQDVEDKEVEQPPPKDTGKLSSVKEEDSKKPAAKRPPPPTDHNNKDQTLSMKRKKKRKKKAGEPDIIKVDFTFCDMNEKYLDGLKSLLINSSTVYQKYSTSLADLMVENVAVGTVVSTEGDEEGTVFGFASVLNVTTYQYSEAIQYLKDICLEHCPRDRQEEMKVVLSGKTKRPAGFLLHGRMINMPLEIVEVLHQQLVLDMDWAVQHAEGGEEERKSLDFGVFVRLAPCQQEGGSVVYRYFEDEILAGQADFTYTVDAPKSYSKELKQLLNILVLTKTGHRAAMQDLAKLVTGG